MDGIWCVRCEVHLVMDGWGVRRLCPVCIDELNKRMVVEVSIAMDSHIIRGEN